MSGDILFTVPINIPVCAQPVCACVHLDQQNTCPHPLAVAVQVTVGICLCGEHATVPWLPLSAEYPHVTETWRLLGTSLIGSAVAF